MHLQHRLHALSGQRAARVLLRHGPDLSERWHLRQQQHLLQLHVCGQCQRVPLMRSAAAGLLSRLGWRLHRLAALLQSRVRLLRLQQQWRWGVLLLDGCVLQEI
jgi:hypothetical protein